MLVCFHVGLQIPVDVPPKIYVMQLSHIHALQGDVEELLIELRNMEVAVDVASNVRALKAALAEPLSTKEAVLTRAAAILLTNC